MGLIWSVADLLLRLNFVAICAHVSSLDGVIRNAKTPIVESPGQLKKEPHLGRHVSSDGSNPVSIPVSRVCIRERGLPNSLFCCQSFCLTHIRCTHHRQARKEPKTQHSDVLLRHPRPFAAMLRKHARKCRALGLRFEAMRWFLMASRYDPMIAARKVASAILPFR